MILLVRSRFVLCIVTAFKIIFLGTLARGIRIDMLAKSPACVMTGIVSMTWIHPPIVPNRGAILNLTVPMRSHSSVRFTFSRFGACGSN